MQARLDDRPGRLYVVADAGRAHAPILALQASNRQAGHRAAALPARHHAPRQAGQAAHASRNGPSLAEVAACAEFSDQSQFCQHFKRLVGVTPGSSGRTQETPKSGKSRQETAERPPYHSP
jgi:AraC-like DNA-binding protein